VFTFLISCGGGGGGGGSDDDSGHNNQNLSQNDPLHRNISGTASKGIISNGLVKAYGVSNGNQGALLASGFTDQDGNYRVEIPSSYNGSLVMEITATDNQSTLMVCDYITGCGTYTHISELDANQNNVIDFGEQFIVPDDFKLRALIPDSAASPELKAMITPLTHMAARYAEQSVAGINDESTEIANTQVASLFELDNSILDLELKDITSPNALSEMSRQELKYAVVAGAVAGLPDNPASISNALDKLASNFSSNNGQLIAHSATDDSITLKTLIENARQITDRFKSDITDTNNADINQKLEDLFSDLNGMISDTETVDNGTPTNAQPSPTAGYTQLKKVTRFIEDLQLWRDTINLNPQTPSFQSTIDTVVSSAGPDLSHLLQTLSIAAQYGAIIALPRQALTAACDHLENGLATILCRSLVSQISLGQTCNPAINILTPGINLCNLLDNFTLPVGGGLYANYKLSKGTARIYGTLNGIDVDLYADNASANDQDLGFNLTANIESDTSRLEIHSGAISVRFTDGLNIKKLELPQFIDSDLKISYQQPSANFEGAIESAIDLSRVRQINTGSDPFTGLDEIDLNISASGNFNIPGAQTFSGQLDIIGGDSNTTTVTIETISPDNLPVEITLKGTPGELTSGLADITLRWGGRTYMLDYDPSSPLRLTIKNQDGVCLAADYGASNDFGTIVIGDRRYGLIKGLVNGSLSIRLADNTEVFL